MWYGGGMKWIVPVAAIFLAGCAESAGEKAEAEYRIASSMLMTLDEKCAAERKIEQGYLSDGDKQNYQRWRIKAGVTCIDADLERLM